MPSAFAVRRARAVGLRQLAGEGDDVGRRVEVEGERGQLLDREGDAGRAGGGDVARAAALAEGGDDRARAGAERERVGAGPVAVGDDRDVALGQAGEQPLELARVQQRAVAGEEDDAARRQLARRGRCQPAPPPSARRRSGSGDDLGARRRRDLRAPAARS